MLDASLTALATTTVLAEDTVNAAPQILDIDVTIGGSTNNFDGESLTISGSGLAQDQLSINNEGNGAGQIGFDGVNVSYGGTVIGVVSSDGSNGADLVIDFDADSDRAGLERLIENITYANNSDNPTTTRTFSFALGAEFSEDMDVVIVANNEAPTVDTNNGVTVLEGGSIVIMAAELGISDPDHTDANVTITVTVTPTNGQLELTTNAGVAINSFTLADLNANRVIYVHNDTETVADSFNFTVTDGTDTTGANTFNITVTSVNDPLALTTNTGADVSIGDEVGIGGEEVPSKFGNHVRTLSGVGAHGNIQGFIDNRHTQFSLVFTTPGSTPNSVPGEVLFESGGAGRGIGLYLNNQRELAWHIGSATATPRLTSPISLDLNTQYSVVIEIDSSNDEVRMHYTKAGNFDWFQFGRPAEARLTNFTQTDYDGGNGAGLGVVGSGSYGGFNGTVSGTTAFQGSIDSDLILTRFPTAATTIENTKLVVTDSDTTAVNIIYTITTDAADGELYNNGVLLSVNDTFTQADLNAGLITYTHGGAVDAADSFIFSVTDGDTVINNQTYNITVDVVNNAPVVDVTSSLVVSEHAANNDVVGTVLATDPDPGQDLTYSITGGTGVGIFDINANTGQVTVLNNATLDFETTASYTLTVRATDDAGVPLFDEHTFTVTVQDVYEGVAPNFTLTGPFNIDENSNNNTNVGTVTAADGDGDNITYSIVGGNTNSTFKIDANSGLIRVNGNDKLNFENRNSYTLTIRATDDSVINEFTNTNVTITVNDLNEGPTLDIGEIIEGQNNGVRYSADTGNFYQYVDSNVKYWQAEAAANAAQLNGVNGHMVTITSAAENTFVDSIIGNHVWLGANDLVVEGEWRWVAGPENGIQFSQGGNPVNGMYENWNGSEPNSANRDRAILHTNGRWYDEGNNSNRRYVIEWENGDYGIINNSAFTISHSAADASDVALNHSVGTMESFDEDGDVIEYTIQGGNGDGIFAIDINTGEITIADKTNLDATLTDSYTLTIRVQEQGGGLFAEKDITITFDQALSVAQNQAVTVTENASVTIDNTDLQVIDADTASTNLVYTVTTQPTNGQLELSNNAGIAITTFTQDDIDNNLLVFVHDGSETLADTFEFSVTDGSETIANQTFNITVNPVNQGPSIATNTGTTVAEGGSVTITNAVLAGSDGDDTAAGITYTANNLANGHIEVGGVIQNTFTQDDINNNRVVFVHDGAEANGSFDFALADGGEDGAGAANGTFTITKTDVNDAPLITTNNPAVVDEGGQVTITTAELNVTDTDDNGAGLTYTLSNIENGFVVLSTAPAIPILSFTQADLDAGRVVFRHGGGENNGSFDVTVADGGENGAGTDTATFTVTRNPINDAPSILINTGSNINQNSIVILKRAVLLAQDPDDNGTGITFTITGTVNGQLEYLANPNVAINSFTQDDIDNSLVVFRHSGPPGAASFDFTIADGGEDGAGTENGTFNLVVDNTNDAPTISTNAAPTFAEGSTSTITTAMLDSFDSDDFGTDLTWTISNLSANGYVQLSSNPGTAITTFTQADLDNGLVQYVHDGSETIAASFDIQVADGGEDGVAPDTGTFNIVIDPVNEAPTITGDLALNVTEGSFVTLTNVDLGFSDVDDVATGVTYTASNLSNGHIEVNGALQNTFTADQLNNGLVRFVHDGGEAATAGFDVSLADGGEDGAGTDSASISISVNPVNDAPVIGVNVGGTMNEGGRLTLTNAMLNEGDVDDAGAGISYSAANLSNGHIEVNGVLQNTFTQADIDNGLVVFVHDGSETLAASFDFTLADGGENGAAVANGTFNIVVNPTNDIPTLALNSGATVAEGGSVTVDNTVLRATDIESADGGLVFTLTSLPDGTFENTNTASVLLVGDTFTQADLDNGFIRYTHHGGEGLSETISFTVGDGTDTSTAFDFEFTVTPVNDDPTTIMMDGGSVRENSEMGTVVASLDTDDPDLPRDNITYTITNDVDGMISIAGNRIIVSDLIDFEIMESLIVDITADDGNGGIVSSSFTISILDQDERSNDITLILREPPKEAPADLSVRAERIQNVDDVLGLSKVIQEGFDNALIDDDASVQILRESTTMLLKTILSESNPIILGEAIQVIEEELASIDNELSNNNAVGSEFTTLEQALALMESLNQDQFQNLLTVDKNSGETINDLNIELKRIEKDLDNIMNYHQIKQKKLYDALADNS